MIEKRHESMHIETTVPYCGVHIQVEVRGATSVTAPSDASLYECTEYLRCSTMSFTSSIALFDLLKAIRSLLPHVSVLSLIP